MYNLMQLTEIGFVEMANYLLYAGSQKREVDVPNCMLCVFSDKER